MVFKSRSLFVYSAAASRGSGAVVVQKWINRAVVMVFVFGYM
jgi:hypothetical protein